MWKFVKFWLFEIPIAIWQSLVQYRKLVGVAVVIATLIGVTTGSAAAKWIEDHPALSWSTLGALIVLAVMKSVYDKYAEKEKRCEQLEAAIESSHQRGTLLFDGVDRIIDEDQSATVLPTVPEPHPKAIYFDVFFRNSRDFQILFTVQRMSFSVEDGVEHSIGPQTPVRIPPNGREAFRREPIWIRQFYLEKEMKLTLSYAIDFDSDPALKVRRSEQTKIVIFQVGSSKGEIQPSSAGIEI